MSGNVAQHIPDADWARSLHDLRSRMHPGSTLAFETRNPGAHEWESWSSEHATSRETRHGTLAEWSDVEVVDDRIVRLQAHNHFAATNETVTKTLTLVFRSPAEIERDLDLAGFAVESVDRNWVGNSFEQTAGLMVFVARAR